MKKLFIPKPNILKSTLETLATDTMLFDVNDPAIIQKCRQIDAEIKAMRAQLNAIIIDNIDQQSLESHLKAINTILDENNRLKKYFFELFHTSILNKNSRHWLHLEMSTKKSNGHPDFLFSEYQLRWRIGMTIEKRFYCDTHMITNPVFYDFLIQEPITTQEIILEFERIKMLIWSLSFNVRSRYFEVCYLCKNYIQPIKALQSYYHSLKGINNGQSI